MRTTFALFAAALLAVSPTDGAGAAQAWQFTFTHLCDGDRCIDLQGSFSGDDADHDGTLSLAELQTLEAGGYALFPDFVSAPGDLPAQGTTTAFSYRIGGDLSFAAQATYYRIGISVLTGEFFSVVGPVAPAGNFAWTPQTQLQVSAVPEPASAALFVLGGLAGLGVMRRRSERPAIAAILAGRHVDPDPTDRPACPQGAPRAGRG